MRKGKTARRSARPAVVRHPRRGNFFSEIETSCQGADCSKHKVLPFRDTKLVSFDFKPGKDQERAELDAKVAFEGFKQDFYRTLRILNRLGDPVGIVMLQLMLGLGGEEVCKRIAKNCTCLPDMSNPFEEWTSPPIPVEVPFQFNGKQRKATFECRWVWQIAHGFCTDIV